MTPIIYSPMSVSVSSAMKAGSLIREACVREDGELFTVTAACPFASRYCWYNFGVSGPCSLSLNALSVVFGPSTRLPDQL